AVARDRHQTAELLCADESVDLGRRHVRVDVVENHAAAPRRAAARATIAQKYSWMVGSSVSSGWKVATSTLPCRASTGSSAWAARVSTPARRRRMRGARMKTISIGVARPSRVALPRASKDSRCRPYALRSTPTSMRPSENCAGLSTSRARRISPAQVPKIGRPWAWNFSSAGTNPHSCMSLSSVVLSPPGMMRPSTSASCSGLRTSPAWMPHLPSALAWRSKSPCSARTPIFTARLAPAAVARLALSRSFHRSPRAGGRRSARTPSVISPLASRRRPSLGSHSLRHFTARLAPAAVARPALPSAGLHQVLFGELGGLDADHRVAEILADLHQHRGILEVRGGLHDGLRAPGRIRRLEDAGAHDHRPGAALLQPPGV